MPNAKIRPRSGTAEEWKSANPVLWEKEIGFEYPSEGVGKGLVKMKMGDGITPWNDLPYAIIESSGAGTGNGNDNDSIVETHTSINNEYISCTLSTYVIGNVCYVSIWGAVVKKVETDNPITLEVDIPKCFLSGAGQLINYLTGETIGAFSIWASNTKLFFCPKIASSNGCGLFSYIIDTEVAVEKPIQNMKVVENDFFSLNISSTIYKNVCYVNVWNVRVKNTQSEAVLIDFELPSTYMGNVGDVVEVPSGNVLGKMFLYNGVKTYIYLLPANLSKEGIYGQYAFSYIIDTEK